MSAQPRLIPKVVKLETSVKKRLEKLGTLKHRSPHWLMREAIMRYLDEEEHHEQLKQETEIRWKEAISGKTVSHQAVSEWLDTWGSDDESDRPPCGK